MKPKIRNFGIGSLVLGLGLTLSSCNQAPVNSQDYAFAGRRNTTLPAQEYSGTQVGASSEGLLVNGGFYSGYEAFKGAHNTRVTNGEFSGPYAFFASQNITITGGLFTGRKALEWSQGATITGGYFSGDDAFNGATNITVYLPNGHIRSLAFPESGVVVARSIGTIHADSLSSDNPCIIFTTDYELADYLSPELRTAIEKKIRVIDTSDLREDVTSENLDEIIQALQTRFR